MLKKTMLLASMALAIAALVAPAIASAEGTLTHEGKPVPTGNHVVLIFTGSMEFDIPDLDSGYTCEVEARSELVSGHPSTGVTTFSILNTSNCDGTGLLADCELVADSTNFLYHIAVTSTDFVVTKTGGTIVINNTFDGNCIVPSAELTFEEITATPNSTSSIATISLHGDGVDDVTGLPITATGDLFAYPTGTYGIE